MNYLGYLRYLNLTPQKCIICGKIVELSLLYVCDTCQRIEKNNILRAQQFLRENPKAAKNEIAKKTGISEKVINWYYKNKKLSEDTQNFTFGITGSKNKTATITGKIYGNFAWINVAGKIDTLSAFELQRYINDLIEDEWTEIILDMNSVTFFSFTGSRVVLAAYKQLCERGSFRIANPSKIVRNIIGMAALDRMLLK